MRIKKARVTNYRSIKDSGWVEFEFEKTILVGPNEAGKSAFLRALQQINPPEGVQNLDPLRDYPRKDYNDISTKKVIPSTTKIVEVHFTLSDTEKAELSALYKDPTLIVSRNLDNRVTHKLTGEINRPTIATIEKDLRRLAAHVDEQLAEGAEKSSVSLGAILSSYSDNYYLQGVAGKTIVEWLKAQYAHIDESNETEESRYSKLLSACELGERYLSAVTSMTRAIPVLVLFSNYYRVRPLIHLGHLASRVEGNLLDDDQYDYGNQCLLKLLGFTARELSNLGKAAEPKPGDLEGHRAYRDQLDQRSYQLNAASVRLTEEIVKIWNPSQDRPEANRLRITADGQYLKVIVEDELGVEIELDQRSEGFQWIVSFFIVFFAEASDRHNNAILLLDEPGLSLHALKQREFRSTISLLAKGNQTIYTTHSPFLVGPDELDLVRVVEMKDRKVGTTIHTTVASTDAAALLPLQEALGYDLAQSLFSQQRNLILEGLTDYWYLEATAGLLRQENIIDLNSKIALIPSNTAGKVVYFATILLAHGLKVAALLDSDNAGESAARQEVLVHRLGAKRILRTMDYTSPTVPKAEIEDLLRDTLVPLALQEFGIDVITESAASPPSPIVDLLSRKGGGSFSKYKLAKAYIRWTRDHTAADLSQSERDAWVKLITAVNAALK